VRGDVGVDLRLSLRRSLLVASILAFACAVLMLPTVAALVTGRAAVSFVYEYQWHLPAWLSWSEWTQTGIRLIVVGALCALLIVAGPWWVRLVGAAGAAWALYAKVALTGATYWTAWMSARGDLTPYTVFTTIDAAVFLAMGVVGLITRSRLGQAPTRTDP